MPGILNAHTSADGRKWPGWEPAAVAEPCDGEGCNAPRGQVIAMAGLDMRSTVYLCRACYLAWHAELCQHEDGHYCTAWRAAEIALTQEDEPIRKAG